MLISKLQVKQKTRVPKVPKGTCAFGGRPKETESSVHGRTKHVVGVSLTDNLCDDQSRREKLPLIARNEGDRKGVIPMGIPVALATGIPSIFEEDYTEMEDVQFLPCLKAGVSLHNLG
jgi:hypothetical protein